MVGITTYGAYVPLFRLDRRVIGGTGEKAICSFDEDSVTMAVAAATDCLQGINRYLIDGLYFASTTTPYKEKLSASIVAMAIDLGRSVTVVDFTNSLKAGVSALKAAADAVKAGSCKNVLVVAADCRLGTPGSAIESNSGDGAAAFLVGDTGVLATLEGNYSVFDEILDVWRHEYDTYVRTWEERFNTQHGYLPLMSEAISGLMAKYKYSPADFAKIVLYTPDARRSAEVLGKIGFNIKTQLQEPLFDVMGNTGTALAPMLLVAALEEAKAGDRVLLAGYGNGSDALTLQVTDRIEKIRNQRHGLKGHLASKRIVQDYLQYLRWRRIVPFEKIAGPWGSYSAPVVWQERDQNLRLHGMKCKVCGTIQYPAQRICTKCHAKDQVEPYRFSDKKAKVFTYSMDYVTPDFQKPTVTVTVDFEPGGRGEFYLSDLRAEEVRVGLPVEMSFRRITMWEDISLSEGAYIYSWKAIPQRFS